MNSEQIERFRNAMKEQFLNVDLVDELCDLALRGLASGEPVSKPMAYACIVDGAFHGAYRHELDAKEAGFETEKRFDLLPLYAAPAPDSVAVPEKIKDCCNCASCDCGNYDNAMSHGYAQGWNACVDAALKAAPAPDSDQEEFDRIHNTERARAK